MGIRALSFLILVGIEKTFKAIFFAALVATGRIDIVHVPRLLVAYLLIDAVCSSSWIMFMWRQLAPVERWRRAPSGSDAVVAEAGRAAAVAPVRIVAANTAHWLVFFGALWLALTRGLVDVGASAAIGGVILFFMATLSMGAPIVTFVVQATILAATRGELSLVARARGVPVPAVAVSIRSQLVFMALGLAGTPAFWFCSVAYATHHDSLLRAAESRAAVAAAALAAPGEGRAPPERPSSTPSAAARSKAPRRSGCSGAQRRCAAGSPAPSPAARTRAATRPPTSRRRSCVVTPATWSG